MLPVLNHVRDTISWEPPPSCIILQMMAVHGQIIYFQPPIDDGLHKGKVQHISQSALWLFASGNLRRNSVGECDRYFGKPPHHLSMATSAHTAGSLQVWTIR